jgi:hypothetical protein
MKLDKDELELLNAYDAGQITVRDPSPKEVSQVIEIADNTMRNQFVEGELVSLGPT